MAFPFVIGNVEIKDGQLVKGFVRETSSFGIAAYIKELGGR
jgi:hypothetical protein